MSDPEATCRRLIAFGGLPWDARCLEFHKTDRPVKTESGVREPVYRTSVLRWRKYGDHLEPLRQAIEGQIQP